ncbi:MAG: SHOCT domain-containing protein [Candidatus Gastranaerophilales bacterium]|nr:SHOCT domain-containing protein [Candidatus Gastranaerophilales bacterium]
MASTSKTAAIIGGVSTVVGGGITAYGYNRYSLANNMISAQSGLDSLFGSSDSSRKTISIWEGRLDNYKIVIVIGAIILVIGVILLASGVIGLGSDKKKSASSQPKTQPKANNKMAELKELDELKDAGYITPDEYDAKRKNILGL